MSGIPENLTSTHAREEILWLDAIQIIGKDQRLLEHLCLIEATMNLCDQFRQYPDDDDDFLVIQFLSMRVFNGFAASLKLILSGYGQNGAMIARDILETTFLLDLFKGDRSLIKRWRLAEGKDQKQFNPVNVRMALDDRYGHTTGRRKQMYDMFSQFAAHPTMKSFYLMRPNKDDPAVIGPFISITMLDAHLFEVGRIAMQVGGHLSEFFPKEWVAGLWARLHFLDSANSWARVFYPKIFDPDVKDA